MSIDRILYKEIEFVKEVRPNRLTYTYYRVFALNFKARDIFKILGLKDKSLLIIYNPLIGLFYDYSTKEVYINAHGKVKDNNIGKLIVDHFYN